MQTDGWLHRMLPATPGNSAQLGRMGALGAYLASCFIAFQYVGPTMLPCCLKTIFEFPLMYLVWAPSSVEQLVPVTRVRGPSMLQ